MFSKAIINPAAVGSSKAICALGGARFQWIGLEDDSNRAINPRSYLVNVEMPLYSIKSGIGIAMEYGQVGFEKNLDVRLNYAYHLPIRDMHDLSFGISFDLMNKTIDYSQFYAFDEGDPNLDSEDTESGMFTDFGIGIYYRLKDKFYGGISASQLPGSSAEIGSVQYDRVPHYFLMAGYDFTLKQDQQSSFVLSTGTLVKTTTAITQIELHALLRYNDKYWGGLMYRLDDAVGIIAGLKVSVYSFGVSYDFTLSDLSKAGSNGSPEFFVRYCYPVSPKVKMRGYYNPRYL
jgi:type IX secretion system PorP/SprF family membrane protein